MPQMFIRKDGFDTVDYGQLLMKKEIQWIDFTLVKRVVL